MTFDFILADSRHESVGIRLLAHDILICARKQYLCFWIFLQDDWKGVQQHFHTLLGSEAGSHTNDRTPLVYMVFPGKRLDRAREWIRQFDGRQDRGQLRGVV